MKNIIKSLSIFLFSICYQLVMYELIIFIPKTLLKYIPVMVWFLIIDFMLVLILYWFYRKDLKEEWMIFKSNWKKILEDNLPYWILGLLIMSILSIIIKVIISKDMPENEKIVRDLLKSFPIYMIISSVIIAPFTEEILYRKTFKDVIKNKYIFMAVCGLVFGLAHVVFSYETPTDFLYVLPYGTLGVVFAYMYDKTKTIFTPMIFHFSHNLLMILITFIASLASNLVG